uniref:Uncharacterized protein n=1 Tax=Myotis myotis TaxID=51298 RepID=A0A7J7YE41_MYOMY|nr:hypothetical protein mMyoMyo1_011155 [Myotis myotis]
MALPAHLLHHPTVALLSLGPIGAGTASTATHCQHHGCLPCSAPPLVLSTCHKEWLNSWLNNLHIKLFLYRRYIYIYIYIYIMLFFNYYYFLFCFLLFFLYTHSLSTSFILNCGHSPFIQFLYLTFWQ